MPEPPLKCDECAYFEATTGVSGWCRREPPVSGTFPKVDKTKDWCAELVQKISGERVNMNLRRP